MKRKFKLQRTNKIPKRLEIVIIALLVSLGISGCAKNIDNTKAEQVSSGITIGDNSYDYFFHNYQMQIDKHFTGLHMDFLRVEDSYTYKNKGIDGRSEKLFSDFNEITIPQSYMKDGASNDTCIKILSNPEYTDTSISVKYMRTLHNDERNFDDSYVFALVEEDMIVNKSNAVNTTYPLLSIMPEGAHFKTQSLYQLDSSKNYEFDSDKDVLSDNTEYLSYIKSDGKLIAKVQTGTGSDEENVQKSNKGNFNEILKSISSISLDSSKEYTVSEANNFIEKQYTDEEYFNCKER